MHNIESFKTESGTPVYQIPIEAFPGLWTYAYLVLLADYKVLIDAGSGLSSATDQLISGIETAVKLNGSGSFSFSDLTHLLITHGHIDHYGGLSALGPQTEAQVGIHELDRRNLTNFQERRTINLHILVDYLVEAGVDPQGRENMLQFYRLLTDLFEPVDVDFTYEAINMELGPFRFLHVPGHSGGHVVIRLENILFCGDHILSDITPHQAPESLSPWSGLNHYLKSLDAVDHWAGDVTLALCGHKQVITDLSGRIAEIKNMHMERLNKVLEFYKSPNTIFALSKSLFGEVNGFNTLLAIEEAGAHVEYLYQRGHLTIVNYQQVDKNEGSFVHYYQRV